MTGVFADPNITKYVATLINMSEREWRSFEDTYLMWKHDLSMAAKYVCIERLYSLIKYSHRLGINDVSIRGLELDIKALEDLGLRIGPWDYDSRRHELYAQLFLNSLVEGNIDDSRKYLMEMARIRRFLG